MSLLNLWSLLAMLTSLISKLADHQNYLSNLLLGVAQQTQDNDFAPGALFARTKYPHLPSQPAIVDPSVETTRRKRAATSRSMLGGAITSTVTNNNERDQKDRERERERE